MTINTFDPKTMSIQIFYEHPGSYRVTKSDNLVGSSKVCNSKSMISEQEWTHLIKNHPFDDQVFFMDYDDYKATKSIRVFSYNGSHIVNSSTKFPGEQLFRWSKTLNENNVLNLKRENSDEDDNHRNLKHFYQKPERVAEKPAERFYAKNYTNIDYVYIKFGKMDYGINKKILCRLFTKVEGKFLETCVEYSKNEKCDDEDCPKLHGKIPFILVMDERNKIFKIVPMDCLSFVEREKFESDKKDGLNNWKPQACRESSKKCSHYSICKHEVTKHHRVHIDTISPEANEDFNIIKPFRN